MPIIEAPTSPTHELPHAHFTSLATPSRGSSETSVWRVHLEPGAQPSFHSVTREEVFVVLTGVARVHIGDQVAQANEGDAIVVPRDTRFAITTANHAAVELLCCLPVGGMARTDGRTFTPPWAE